MLCMQLTYLREQGEQGEQDEGVGEVGDGAAAVVGIQHEGKTLPWRLSKHM